MTATSERVLPRTWALTAADLEKLCGQPVTGDPGRVLVDDVEGLCRGALKAAQDRGAIARDIETGDWLEVLGFLLGEVVKRGQRFDPTRRGIEFRPWLYEQLRAFSVIEAQRWLYGRNGQHRVAGGDRGEPGPGDAVVAAAVHDGPHFAGRSRGAPADPADGWIADLSGLAAVGDRFEDGLVGGAGREARRGAAGGDHGAGVGAGGRAAGGAGRSAHWVDCVACGWRSFAQPPNGLPGWHLPEVCAGCGAPLDAEEVAA